MNKKIDGLLARLSANNRNQPTANDCSKWRAEFAEYGNLMGEADAAGWPSEAKEKLLQCRGLLAAENHRRAQKSRRLKDCILNIIRLVIGATTIFGGSLALFLLTPLLLLNPILRKLGVNQRYFPLNIAENLYTEAVLAGLWCKLKIQGEPAEKVWGQQAFGILTYNHAYVMLRVM